MMQFACPTCRAVLESPEERAGEKFPCPGCGQRLQIPYPPQRLNKTVLGEFLPEDAVAATPPQLPPDPSPANVVMRCP
jgi:hypothetical protein